MSNQPNDRARMRNDLRELAKLAAPSSSPAPASHRFDTADSSGYVDLSAFSATDSSWVDRELARAKGGSAPPPVPGTGAPAKGRAIDRLSPESMTPVSLESFLVAETTASTRVPRGRRALYAVLAAASVAGVAALAVVVTKHAPPPEKAAAVAPPVAPPAETAAATATTTAPPAAATETSPAPSTESSAAPAASAPAPQSSAASKAATAAAPGKKKAPAFHAHGAAAPAAAPPRAAAAPAAKPVVIPQAKTKSSGDSLMDAIRNSVSKGK